MSTSDSQRQPFGWGKLGLPIVLAAFVSYFMIFAKYPATRDFPWVNLPIMLVGVWIAWLHHWRNRKALKLLSRLFSSLLLTGAVLITSLFCFYVFSYSYQLPEAGNGLAVEQQPKAFTLKDHAGNDVSLADYQGKNVIISFYRGYW